MKRRPPSLPPSLCRTIGLTDTVTFAAGEFGTARRVVKRPVGEASKPSMLEITLMITLIFFLGSNALTY